MRSHINILLVIASAFFLSFHIAFAQDDSQNTEKYKIISACCINNQWSFNIYDGVKNKTSIAKLNRRNAEGILVENFDESTQTAIISTPRGRFKITLQIANLSAEQEKESTKAKDKNSAVESNNSDSNSEHNKSQKITRKAILQLIK